MAPTEHEGGRLEKKRSNASQRVPYRGERGPLGELARQATIRLDCADHLTRHLAPRIRLLHSSPGANGWLQCTRTTLPDYSSSRGVVTVPLTRAVMGGSPNVTLFELADWDSNRPADRNFLGD